MGAEGVALVVEWRDWGEARRGREAAVAGWGWRGSLGGAEEGWVVLETGVGPEAGPAGGVGAAWAAVWAVVVPVGQAEAAEAAEEEGAAAVAVVGKLWALWLG